jgi:hypothetical protein
VTLRGLAKLLLDTKIKTNESKRHYDRWRQFMSGKTPMTRQICADKDHGAPLWNSTSEDKLVFFNSRFATVAQHITEQSRRRMSSGLKSMKQIGMQFESSRAFN